MDIIVVTVTKLSLHNYTLSLSPNSHCTIIRCHCYQILTAQLYFVTVTKLSLHNYMLPLSPNCHCTIIRCHCHQILTAQLCNLCHCHKILTAQLCNRCHCHKILTAQLQIPLLEKTRLLTNFLTPFGKTYLIFYHHLLSFCLQIL